MPRRMMLPSVEKGAQFMRHLTFFYRLSRDGFETKLFFK